MSKHEIIEGIILKKQAIFDYDALLTIFSKEKGLIKVLAKFAYTKKFRFGGYMDNQLKLSFQVGKGKTFFYLKDISVITSYSEIRSSYNKIMLNHYFSKILCTILEQEQVNEFIYELYCQSLEHLNNGSPIGFVQDYFQDNLLEIEGIQNKDRPFKQCIEEYTGSSLENPRFIKQTE